MMARLVKRMNELLQSSRAARTQNRQRFEEWSGQPGFLSRSGPGRLLVLFNWFPLCSSWQGILGFTTSLERDKPI